MALTGMLLALSFGLVALLLFAPPARADHNVVEHVSQGVTGGNGTFNPNFGGASEDGSVALVHTTEQLVAADTDTTQDAYRRAGGVTELATAGPASTGPSHPFTAGMSRDGSTVFFHTRDALVAGDTDTSDDAYMYRAGATTLLSSGPTGCGVSQSFPVAWSNDGSMVLLHSTDRLLTADTDCNTDLYQYSGGTLSLVQPGPGGTFAYGNSADGQRVFFVATDPLVPEDSDTMQDLYRRDGAALTLVSRGSTGGNGPFNAFNGGRVSETGDRVYFATQESLVPEDADTAIDIYLWEDGGTAQLATTGPAGGNSGMEASHRGMSADGSHLFFSTSEALVPEDMDTRVDLYDRSAGSTSLVSTGPAGGNGAFDASGLQHGFSEDGGKVLFLTNEKLVAADNNSLFDLYMRTGGQTTLAAIGPTGDAVPNAFLHGISADGSKVFFTTNQSLVSADTDGVNDLYERSGSITTLLSIGPNGGNGAIHVSSSCCPQNLVSADGSRVFFDTSESLVSTDTDSSSDVYSASVGAGPAAGYPRPKGATPLRVALVPAFQPCGSPNRNHGPPLAFDSCSPPAPDSARLTVGSPDANGQPAAAEGFVKYEVLVGNPATTSDEADVAIQARITDVRVQGTLADYTGTLGVVSTVRVTDKNNGTGPEPATVDDLDMPALMTCAPAAGSAGATCSLNTTFDAIAPGTVTEARRTVWALDRIRVFDGGADDNAFTQPNGVFATQGVFVP
jgi:hypothetical protein